MAGEMIEVVGAYVLMTGFLAIETFLRKGAAARSLEPTGSDSGTTRLVGVSLGFALGLPVLLNLIDIGRVAAAGVGWIGLAIMLLGLLLRVWSMRILGAYYSRRLRVAEAHAVIAQGPYRFIRHPGYLGTMLTTVGFGLALSNGIGTVIAAVILLGVYGYRIRTDESMLLATFGDSYRKYQHHTWRFLPWLY